MTLISGARAQQLMAALLALDDDEHQTFIADQQAVGLAPRNAVRPLHDHELAARTRFADLEDDRDAAVAEAEAMLAQLHDDIKQAYLSALFGDDFDGELTPAQAIEVIHALNTDQPEPIAEGESSIVPLLAGLLAAAYLLSGRRVIEEAERQGASVSSVSPAVLDAEQFMPQALAVSTHPWRRISGKIEAEFTDQRWASRDTISRDDVERVLDDIKVDGSRDEARQAVNGASGAGRIDTVDQAPAGELEPDEVWASEIMDGDACTDCVDIDGTEYASLADARQDYPDGQYRNCRGGQRCRGTLVFLFR